MRHGSSAEWSVVGARGRYRGVGSGGSYGGGVVARQWAADPGPDSERPHCPAAGLCAAAAVC